MILVDHFAFKHKADRMENREDWKQSDCYLLLANGYVAGAIAINPNEYFDWDWQQFVPAPGCLYVSSTAILPAFRGFGLGKYLKEWQIDYASDHDMHTVKITTRASNRMMRRLNENFGFKVVARLPYAYSGPKEDGLDMELTL